jgi:hypothetical protein
MLLYERINAIPEPPLDRSHDGKRRQLDRESEVKPHEPSSSF